MRFVVQRVTHASVTVDGNVIGKIGQGFMVLIGVSDEDTKETAAFGKDRKSCKTKHHVSENRQGTKVCAKEQSGQHGKEIL